MPIHLVAKGLAIDYSIGVARAHITIGKRLTQPQFEADVFLDDLGKVLYQAIGDLGIKTLPDKAGEDRITHYIVTYYRDFTIQDLRMAFELAIVGDLGVDIEHYHSFDLKYICSILNAYRIRRNRALSVLEKLKMEQEKPKELTEEEQQQIKQDFILSVCRQYQKFCETGELGVISVKLVYELLEEKRVLVIDDEMLLAHKKRAIEKYKIQLSLPKNNRESKSFRAILADFEKAIEGPEKFTIERLIKEQLIKEFFTSCKQKNINLNQIIQ